MSQQINLLDPQLVKPKVSLNALMLVAVIGGVGMCMLAYAVWTGQQLSELEREQQAVSSRLAQARAQLDQAVQARTPRAPSKALEEELARAEAALAHQRDILALLDGEGTGQAQGYFAYLQVFARKRLPGLWLTGFTLDAATGKLTIEGKAMQPELVPQYITLLGEEPLLSGRQFSALQMESQKTPSGKEAAAPADAGSVEFKLQSMELHAALQAPVTTEVRP